MTTFVFTGSSFAMRPFEGTLTTFIFDKPRLSVLWATPAPPVVEPVIFTIGCRDSPQSTYRFFDRNAYRFWRDDYVPSSTFTIPMPCYGGDAVGDLPITGTGIGNLSRHTSYGTGMIIEPVNRLLVREPVCSPSQDADRSNMDEVEVSQEVATSANNTIAIASQGADPFNLLNCYTQVNAIPVSATTCIGGTDEGLMVLTTLCLAFENAIPVAKVTESSVDNGILINGVWCLLRDQGIPVPSDDVCVPLRDMSDVEYLEKKTIHAQSGEPYVPSNTFAPSEYGIGDEAVTLCKYVFADYQLTFKMNNDPSISVFEMLEYQPATFFTPLLFYPARTACNYFPMIERRWQWLIGSSVEAVVNQGVSPLRSYRCSNNDGAVETKSSACSLQDEAMTLPPGTSIWIDPEPEVDPDPPGGGGETVIIPIQEVYKVSNSITVTLADGTTPVELANVGLDFDVDAHSWSWSGVLLSVDQLNVLKPGADGVAVLIHVTINGVLWHLTIERLVVNRTFGKKGITLSGRGLSALLDAPYQDATSVRLTTLLSNQQIAESFLPFGWTLVWEIPTWNIPANNYSHQDLTPAVALLQFVQMCGAILVPSRASQTITVRKRYPVVPWLFAPSVPDLIVPDSIIIGLTEEPVSTHGANGVYVHGFEGDGVQALCRITGTDGARLADTASNSLMVDSTAIRALGERVLAGEYVQPIIRSITTLMDGGATIDLVEAGTFIEFVVDAVQDRGIVNSISIATSTSEQGGINIIQSMTIGESTNNVYSLFQEFVPTDAVLLCSLISTDGTTSIVSLVDGDIMRVRGTGTVGQKYYLKGGAIEGDAPAIPIIAEVVV